jgi:type IV pilus assembly protein PilO
MALPGFLDPIVAAPKWQKIVFGLLGLGVIGGVAYFVLLSPVEGRIAQLSTQRAALQRELVDARRNVADIARFRHEIAELEKRIDLVKEKLPTEKEMPGLYRTLSEAAYQAGLGVALFQPREPKVQDYYSEVPIVVSAEGGYHQVGEFLEKMAGMSRVVNLTDWKLTGHAKGKGSLRADLILATYMYRPVGSPPAPKSPAAGVRPASAPPAGQAHQ